MLAGFSCDMLEIFTVVRVKSGGGAHVRGGLMVHRARLGNKLAGRVQRVTNTYSVIRHVTSFYLSDLKREVEQSLVESSPAMAVDSAQTGPGCGNLRLLTEVAASLAPYRCGGEVPVEMCCGGGATDFHADAEASRCNPLEGRSRAGTSCAALVPNRSDTVDFLTGKAGGTADSIDARSVCILGATGDGNNEP